MGNIGNTTTIRDIAAACEVSTATVSRVLNDIPGGYSALTEAKIRKTAEELGYVPNRMARSLITRRTNLIALLVPDIHYVFFQDFFVGLEQYMNGCGYRVLLCNTQEKQEQEASYIRELCSGLVDGIIISTLNKWEKNSAILDLSKRGFPMLLLERYGKDLSGICELHVDNYGSCKMAVDHLYECGHRKIAFIKGSDEAYNARIRYEGYLDGLRDNDLPFCQDLVVSGNYSFESGVSAMEKLLDTGGFTAVIGSNDLMTVGACSAIAHRGLKIPDDLSVVGVDSTSLTRTHEPSITAVDFCGKKLGEKAGIYLMDMIGGGSAPKQVYQQQPRMEFGNSTKII